ncbi:MAG: DNA topoisomerase 3 [Actinomycetota bacterium]|nr:DNA topoisomerase 3 [Actinomycetota bacterium]
MKTLVVAEKPSVARDLADALPGSFQNEDTYYESDDYVVTFAVGHLVQLVDPEHYDEKLKKWRMADLPIVPEVFKLQPRDAKAKKQLNAIHKLIKRDDIDRIINACDAGREGELIFAYIYETSGTDKPVERLWINSMTKAAIRDGFERLRPGEQLASLEAAARSRSEADWLVGMNATRAATIRGRAWVGGVVSLGRVQTPTLAMMVQREREIQAFTPEPYRLVRAQFGPEASLAMPIGGRGGSAAASGSSYEGLWFEGDETRIFGDLSRADKIVEKVTGSDGTVESVERKEQSERAPLLYDLTSLQRDANRRFGFSARRTLQAAQSLYEDKKAITYPRTSSRFLSGDMVPLLKPTAETLRPIDEYRPYAEYVLSLDQLPLGRVVNDARVTDHHAIIPTDVEHDLDRFSPDERRIFALVAKRFLAVFHPAARYARTTIVTLVEEERFRTRGKITLEAGWRGVYGLESDEQKKQEEESEGEGVELPQLEQGQSIRCVSAELEDKQTKPPPRYTEATLLSAMETAGKRIDDEELREAMKESGLGTPATRAEMIETLIRREYIERAGKDLQPTPKGLQVITMLEQHPLTSPELTGDWEKRLSDIERGEGDRDAFIKGIVDLTTQTVEQIAALDKEKLRPERVELGPCPRCGAETGEIIKENSRAYGCTSWKSREEPGCGFVIWKRVASRTLTPEVARQLLENGRTNDVISGFRSKAGKPFRARLVLNDEGKVEFDFPARAQTKEAAVAE